MRSLVFILLFSACESFGLASGSQPASSDASGPACAPLEGRAAQEIRAYREELEVPGLYAALVTTAGECQELTLGSAAAGAPESVTPETVFELGSVSKALTGLALAHAVTEGLLDPQSPVGTLFPDAVFPDFQGEPIRLLHLVSHSSGLPRVPEELFEGASPDAPYAHLSDEKVLASLTRISLSAPPGERVEYSNLGMGLAGHVAARSLGFGSYGDFVRAHALSPLGSSGFFEASESVPERAVGMGMDGRSVPPFVMPESLKGAGIWAASGSSLRKFLMATMNPPVAMKAAVSLALTPVSVVVPGRLSVGYGWHVLHRPEGDVVWHNGATMGFASFVGFLPGSGKGVVVLGNRADFVEMKMTRLGFSLLD